VLFDKFIGQKNLHPKVQSHFDLPENKICFSDMLNTDCINIYADTFYN